MWPAAWHVAGGSGNLIGTLDTVGSVGHEVRPYAGGLDKGVTMTGEDPPPGRRRDAAGTPPGRHGA